MKIFSFLLTIATLAHAQLVFEKSEQNITAPPDVTTLPADFIFENKGKTNIHIDKCAPSCSCMSVQIGDGGKLDYAPGEKGTIRATFDMSNFSGQTEKMVAIYLQGDPPNKPSHQLLLHINIPVLVNMEPKTLEWKMGEKLDAKSLKITMNHSEPIRILKAQCSNKLFLTELKTITEGKEYDLVVTPVADSKVPHGVGVVHIDTDCKIERQKKQMAFAVVRTTPPQIGAPPAPNTSPAPPLKK